MDEYAFGTKIDKNSNPMVDFKYDIQKNKSIRKSVFEMFSPIIKKKNVFNNDPKELFHANKKINSILYRNLKTIYDENKNDIPKDNPIFDNVNCLIQKNNIKNRYLYKKILNSHK